jgi:hypothetical protein
MSKKSKQKKRRQDRKAIRHEVTHEMPKVLKETSPKVTSAPTSVS